MPGAFDAEAPACTIDRELVATWHRSAYSLQQRLTETLGRSTGLIINKAPTITPVNAVVGSREIVLFR